MHYEWQTLDGIAYLVRHHRGAGPMPDGCSLVVRAFDTRRCWSGVEIDQAAQPLAPDFAVEQGHWDRLTNVGPASSAMFLGLPRETR